MAAFDYDVVIIGSGFGGCRAALRAAERGSVAEDRQAPIPPAASPLTTDWTTPTNGGPSDVERNQPG